MDQLIQLLSLPVETSGLGIPILLLNLGVGVAIGTLMRAHYIRCARSLANRELFASNFTPLILAIVLIISIVKASLALSLGLVGALSIVRFRTPIKDPEELIYLFLAIAAGLGLGANQTVATIAAMAFIFGFLTLRTRSEQAHAGRALYLEIEFEPGDRPDDVLRSLIDLMKPTLQTVNLRRFDTGDSGLLASFSVSCDHSDQVGMTAAAIRREWPSARVTFLDQDHIPGV